MPRYVVILTEDEIQELKALVQKGEKSCHIRHAQILLKLGRKPENKYNNIYKCPSLFSVHKFPLYYFDRGIAENC